MAAEPGHGASYVFLSYASVDRAKALRIADLLESQGVTVWIDRKSIAGGTSWTAEIVRGIQGCVVLAVLCSGAAVRSKNVQQEIQLAWECDRPVLPLLLEKVELPEVLRYTLAGRQWIEITDRPDDVWLADALRALGGLGVQVRKIEESGSTLPIIGTAGDGGATGQGGIVSRRHNLPSSMTAFIGRERELAEVKQRVGASRLVTLTGTGGCGKSRLALQVSANLLDVFPDGVWLIELAPLADPALLAQTIARALGVQEEPSRPILTTLLDFLRSLRLLLVVDNCEHLITACAQVTETILRDCPDASILATSREALGLGGENAWRVPSLTLPAEPRPAATSQTAEAALLASEAARLFVDRARSAEPGFAVTAQNAPAIAQICRRLDGIPLAIELAAARLKVLSVDQIAARLDDRFRLLTGGSRTALPRQQTLRATLDWSYNLLGEPERRLLRRLSIFVSGCTLEAAEAVCGGEWVEEESVVDLLSQLVDKSLVVVDKEAGEPRYRLSETVRQYARERLFARGELDDVERRHAAYYLSVATEASHHLQGPDQVNWLDRLQRDHDNLRATVHWAIEREDAELGMRLAASLSYFWYFRGHFSEGRALRAAILALPSGPELAALRAELLQGLGMLALRQGDYPAARAYSDEGLAIARQVGDPRLEVSMLATLGFVARVQDDYVVARAALEEAVALTRELGDTFHTAMVLHHLGLLALEADRNVDTAWSLNKQSLALYRQIGNRRMVGVVLGNMGRVARARGDLVGARALLAETVTVLGDVGDLGPMPQMLYTLASVDADVGHLERAVRLQAAATKLEEVVGTRVWPANLRERDAWLGPARVALGEASFARAWAEGQAMTLEQAMAYAMQQTDAPGEVR